MDRGKLLLVDDAKLFLHLCTVILSREDYVLYTATNGRDALDLARRKKPDVVLLDLHMPGMDGDEVCRWIRSDPATRDVPVIMIASDADGEVRKRSFYSGCDDFITKPLWGDTLRKTIRKHLSLEERSHPRARVTLPCLLDSGREVVDSTIHTLSAGGAYAEVDPPPLPGTAHRLIFDLPEAEEFFVLHALARWNRHVHGERPAGSGFEFVGAGEDQYRRISHWVQDTLDDPVFS